MFQRPLQALVGLPFPEPAPNALREEFDGWPIARRRQLMRKCVQRELLIALTGQGRRRVERVPAGVRRVLWHYTWTTLGDSVMDLAPRTLLPPEVELELLICPMLAPLFEHDARFARVHTTPEQCQGPYDFLLLHHFSTDALAVKRRFFRDVPFASMIGHLAGEMFARLQFADHRLRHLFGLPPGPTAAPTLTLPAGPRWDRAHMHVAVSLGARDERRRYGAWYPTLAQVVARWPQGVPPPRFHLFGTANARPDLASIPEGWLQQHAVNHVEQLSLLDALRYHGTCDAFLGIDSGPMHVAAALRQPGVALFTAVNPAYRLLPDSSIEPVTEASPEALAQAFVDRVRRAFASAGALDALHRHA